MTRSPATSKRNVQLDVLRAVAIFLVLFRHFSDPMPDSPLLLPVAVILHRIGWLGVDLFFVLSGFLIGNLLLGEYTRTGAVQIGRFLLRRTLRIWPLYYMYLAYLLFLYTCVDTDRTPLWPNLLFLQNYTAQVRGHLWSLAVEEHFYVLLPALVALLRRRRSPTPFGPLPAICASMLILCSTLRAVARLGGVSNHAIYMQTHFRIDSLFVGVFVAYYFNFEKPAFLGTVRGHLASFLWGGLLLLAPMCFVERASQFSSFGGFTLVSLGCACILSCAVAHADAFRTSKWVRAMAFVGKHSYPIYLLHEEVSYVFLEHHFPRLQSAVLSPDLSWVSNLGIGTLLSIAVGVTVSLAMETPLLRLRDRLVPAAVPVAAEADR